MADGLALVGAITAWVAAVWWFRDSVRHEVRRGVRWTQWRIGSFAAGFAALLLGALPLWGGGFSGHVVAHLLLGMVGPLLVVLADPLTLILGQMSVPTRRRALRLLASPVARTVSRPAVAWLVAILTPWVLWLTPLYALTERHVLLHAAVHLHFVGAGLVFAAVVLGSGPIGRHVAPATGVLLLALALPAHALLGLVVLSMSEPLIESTAGGLADQRRGAAIMWLAGDLIATMTMAAAFPRWLRDERRRSRREDAAVAAQLAAGAPSTTFVDHPRSR